MFYCTLDAQFRTCAFQLERFHLSKVRALRYNDKFFPIRGSEPLAVVALCVTYNLSEHLAGPYVVAALDLLSLRVTVLVIRRRTRVK